jgi:chlorobactene glucosyltransferase
MFIMLVANLITYRSLAAYGYKRRYTASNAPKLSILVPARNEAASIARCIRSLINQDYPNLEIIVLDDNSEDATEAILESIAREDMGKRLRLVSGQPLPGGWLGKNWACHQLVQYADGDYLLFTDADTVHAVSSAASAMAALEQNEADFLSVFPRQETGSLAERLAVPLMLVYVLGLLPNWMVKSNPSPAFSAANGQFMLFKREAYEAIGGHEAVQNIVLEDVVLGRHIKQAGLKQILPDGTDTVSCRMYRNGSEVWQGFSKNLYAFFGFKIAYISLFMLLNLLAFIGPYLWLFIGFITGQPANLEWLWLPIAQIVLAWGIRLGVAARFGFPAFDIFLHPFSIIYMAIIGVNSIRWSRRGLIWKGRKYTTG